MNKKEAMVIQAVGSCKYALLDTEQGRIDAYCFTRSLPLATVVRYQPGRQLNNVIVMDRVDIDQMPLALAREDILFVHHVLELCYQFVPIGSGSAGIFDLLRHLYVVDHQWCRQRKKIFVLQLLAMIGYYPEYGMQRIQTWIDNSFGHLVLTEQDEREIDQWLARCIAYHPRVAEFKTLHFLHDS